MQWVLNMYLYVMSHLSGKCFPIQWQSLLLYSLCRLLLSYYNDIHVFFFPLRKFENNFIGISEKTNRESKLKILATAKKREIEKRNELDMSLSQGPRRQAGVAEVGRELQSILERMLQAADEEKRTGRRKKTTYYTFMSKQLYQVLSLHFHQKTAA